MAAGADFGQGVPAWSQDYANAQPFPHIVLDGLFDPGLLRAVDAEITSSISRNANSPGATCPRWGRRALG
jgi:hypothetical protein